MKTENFIRAKEIETSIENLTNYRRTLTTDRKINFYLKIEGRLPEHTGTISCTYDPDLSSRPAFLKEQLRDDLNFIADRLLVKIDRHIAELEKEFETL